MGTTAPTYAQFIALFPAFSAVSQPIVEDALSLSANLLDESAWGNFFSNAVGLDAAHNLAMNSLLDTISGSFKNTAGPLTSASAAGASASFASPPNVDGYGSNSWYSKTTYGQRFMRLRAVVIPPGGMCA